MSFSAKAQRERLKRLFAYRLIQEHPIRIYNLGFGDWNEEKGDIEDMVATNNLDRQKVLATVADTVLDFTGSHPVTFVFAQGSTPAQPAYIKWESVLSGMKLGHYF